MKSGIASVHVLDPWSERALPKELPSLPIAFDEDALREPLQAALLGPPTNDWAIEDLALTKAVYLPGERCMVRYRVQIRNGGAPSEVMLIGNVFPDARASRSYFASRLAPLASSSQGRPHVLPLPHVAAHLEPLNMTVSLFPLDGELPTLLDATDPALMLDVLRSALTESRAPRFDADRCRVDLVRYGRQHRCVLRYTLTDSRPRAVGSPEMTVYGKVASDGRGALASAALSDLREHLGPGPEPPMRIPRPLGFIEDLGLQLLGAVSGGSLIRPLLQQRVAGRHKQGTARDGRAPTLEQAIEAAGAVAASIHGSGVRFGPERSIWTELSELEVDRAAIERLSGGFGAQLGEWMNVLARRAEASEPTPPLLAHGDFTISQLLFDGRSPGLVDFDTICRADPALDLGRFIAHLRLAGAKAARAVGSATSDPELDRLCDRLLGAYARTRGLTPREHAELAERVRLFELVGLLHIAARGWHKLKAKRLHLAAGLIRTRLASLEGRG